MSSAFLKNCWYVAAWSHEVNDREPFARTLLNEDVVLYRGRDGKPLAFVDRCPHRLAPLSKGRIEGDALRCMYHGLLFDPSGRCIDIPQQDIIPPRLKVAGFPLVERDTFIWIWMGDPDLADPAKIPDAHWQDDPAWRSIPCYVHYDNANFMLIADNLLDLSHLGFVHENTLGGGRTSAEVRPVLEKFDWGVRVTRIYQDPDVPPYLRNVAPFSGAVDRWQIYEWHIDGTMFSMDSGSAPIGLGVAEGHRPPEALQFHSCQALTPETDTSTHYFWTYAHDFALDDPNITRELAEQIRIGFEEDKQIIQAQQSVISRHPDAKLQSFAADGALQQIRLMMSRRLREEQAMSVKD